MDEKILTWISEVRRYNRRLHLVSRSMEKDLEKQVENTLCLLKKIEEPGIADLGAGSGFLAVPYKITHPGSLVWMIERSQKKGTFLRHIIDLLGLRDMELIDFDPREKKAGPFPAVMSRSFSPRQALADTVLSILSQTGRFYYFSAGAPAAIKHPRFIPQDRFSRSFADYQLTLEAYGITSRR